MRIFRKPPKALLAKPFLAIWKPRKPCQTMSGHLEASQTISGHLEVPNFCGVPLILEAFGTIWKPAVGYLEASQTISGEIFRFLESCLDPWKLARHFWQVSDHCIWQPPEFFRTISTMFTCQTVPCHWKSSDSGISLAVDCVRCNCRSLKYNWSYIIPKSLWY